MLLTKQKKKKKVSTEIMMLKELMGKVNQNTPFNILRYKYRLKVWSHISTGLSPPRFIGTKPEDVHKVLKIKNTKK